MTASTNSMEVLRRAREKIRKISADAEELYNELSALMEPEESNDESARRGDRER